MTGLLPHDDIEEKKRKEQERLARERSAQPAKPAPPTTPPPAQQPAPSLPAEPLQADVEAAPPPSALPPDLTAATPAASLQNGNALEEARSTNEAFNAEEAVPNENAFRLEVEDDQEEAILISSAESKGQEAAEWLAQMERNARLLAGGKAFEDAGDDLIPVIDPDTGEFIGWVPKAPPIRQPKFGDLLPGAKSAQADDPFNMQANQNSDFEGLWDFETGQFVGWIPRKKSAELRAYHPSVNDWLVDVASLPYRIFYDEKRAIWKGRRLAKDIQDSTSFINAADVSLRALRGEGLGADYAIKVYTPVLIEAGLNKAGNLFMKGGSTVIRRAEESAARVTDNDPLNAASISRDPPGESPPPPPEPQNSRAPSGTDDLGPRVDLKSRVDETYARAGSPEEAIRRTFKRFDDLGPPTPMEGVDPEGRQLRAQFLLGAKAISEEDLDTIRRIYADRLVPQDRPPSLAEARHSLDSVAFVYRHPGGGPEGEEFWQVMVEGDFFPSDNLLKRKAISHEIWHLLNNMRNYLAKEMPDPAKNVEFYEQLRSASFQMWPSRLKTIDRHRDRKEFEVLYEEGMADAFAVYIVLGRDQIEKTSPLVAKFLREKINTDPAFKDRIALLSILGVAMANGLIGPLQEQEKDARGPT